MRTDFQIRVLIKEIIENGPEILHDHHAVLINTPSMGLVYQVKFAHAFTHFTVPYANLLNDSDEAIKSHIKCHFIDAQWSLVDQSMVQFAKALLLFDSSPDENPDYRSDLKAIRDRNFHWNKETNTIIFGEQDA